jgi:hypothetical protein
MVKQFLTSLYFIVVAAVTIFTLMFGAVDLLSAGLKTYVFTAADVPSYLETCDTTDMRFPVEEFSDAAATDKEGEYIASCESRNEQSIERYHQQKAESAVQSLSMILVSLPLFLLHFRVVYRDWKNEGKPVKKK